MADQSITGQCGGRLEAGRTIASRARNTERCNLELALGYARGGIPVFPCDDRKRPLASHGHHDATTDLVTIRRWSRRWPSALVGIPTGPDSGIWVLDVDGEAGRSSLNALLARLNVDRIADLTPCVARTAGAGLHLYFRLQSGERPRNRARDIGAGLDTRGLRSDGMSAGYVIAPGSTLPDGRRYQLIDPATLEPIDIPTNPFGNAPPAPRELLYLASFNAAERAVITRTPGLREAIQQSEPSKWPAILERQRTAQRVKLQMPSAAGCGDAHKRQWMYARCVLERELRSLSAMRPNSGRNDRAFRLVCRMGRWVHAGIITRAELTEGVLDACERNGLVADDGRKAVLDTIASGLAKSANDSLPVLEERS